MKTIEDFPEQHSIAFSMELNLKTFAHYIDIEQARESDEKVIFYAVPLDLYTDLWTNKVVSLINP